MSIFAIFEPIDETIRYWTGIKLKQWPKQFNYEACRGQGMACYNEGVQEDNL